MAKRIYVAPLSIVVFGFGSAFLVVLVHNAGAYERELDGRLEQVNQQIVTAAYEYVTPSWPPDKLQQMLIEYQELHPEDVSQAVCFVSASDTFDELMRLLIRDLRLVRMHKDALNSGIPVGIVR